MTNRRAIKRLKLKDGDRVGAEELAALYPRRDKIECPVCGKLGVARRSPSRTGRILKGVDHGGVYQAHSTGGYVMLDPEDSCLVLGE